MPATYAGKKIQIRLDSTTGTVIGTYTMQSTGGWGSKQAQTTSLSVASGVHDVYLVVSGENSSGSGLIDWIRFE